jgi:hypothetical protein
LLKILSATILPAFTATGVSYMLLVASPMA